MAGRGQLGNPVALRGFVGVMVAVVVAAPVVVSGAAPAYAAGQTRYVSTSGSDANGDANSCLISSIPCMTIQHAVDESNAGDTVKVAAGPYAESVIVEHALTITGAGSGSTTVSGDDGGDPALEVEAPGSTPVAVSLNEIALSGNTSGAGLVVDAATATLTSSRVVGNGSDGVSLVDGSTVHVSRSIVDSNTSDGIWISELGTSHLTVTSSEISSNGESGVELQAGAATVADDHVSHNHTGGLLVGLDHPASAQITRSSFDGDTGFGVESGSVGQVSISRSTVDGSIPFATSGTDDPYGGGLLALGGSITARDITVFGNTSFGVGVQSTVSSAGSAQIANSTVTATKPSTGSALVGGLAVIGGGASLHVTGTIDAANKVPDCNVHVTDAGYNLDSDGKCGLHAVDSRSHASAKLGTFGAHGGPTETVLPRLHSAARNVIPFGKAGCVKGATDQRGQPRREPKAGKCDIGSVEVKVVNPKLHAKVSGHKVHGGYRGPVTVKYHCKASSAPLTHKCPKATHLSSTGHHHVKKTIHAVDGGTATVKLHITIK